jgi:hypothetical protein
MQIEHPFRIDLRGLAHGIDFGGSAGISEFLILHKLDGGFAFARDDIQQGYAEFESVLAPIIQPLIKGSPLKNISAKQIAHVLVTSTRGFKQVSRNSSEYRNLIESLLTMTLTSLERPGNFP